MRRKKTRDAYNRCSVQDTRPGYSPNTTSPAKDLVVGEWSSDPCVLALSNQNESFFIVWIDSNKRLHLLLTICQVYSIDNNARTDRMDALQVSGM